MKRTTVVIAAVVLALLPLGAWGQSDSEKDFFGGDEATVAAPPAAPAVDPTKQFNESSNGAQWGGYLLSDATWNPGWVGGLPGDPNAAWNDGLSYDLLATAYLDSRPDKNFRVRFSLQAGYPFTTTVNNVVLSPTPLSGSSLTTPTTTDLTVPNLKVWELFTDVTVDDFLFLRFGKQSASWGVAYFYSVADVISLTSINVLNPTLQREGPVALKATIPFPNLKANLTGFALARDSYFTNQTPAISSLGYALQGDILVGEAQLTLGGFYQEASAPKLVATVNTGLGFLNLPINGTIDVFTEAIVSRGSDSLLGSGTSTLPAQGVTYTTYQSLSPWPQNAYYTGTAGFNYSNNEYNFSLRGEYLYNPFGSADKDAASKTYGTYFATLANQFQANSLENSSGQLLGSSNLLYTGIHNATVLFDITKIANSKLEFSTLAQGNFSDGSGWVRPYFTVYPWTQLGLSWGLQYVYGDDGTQYPMQFESYSASGVPLGTKRLSLVIEVFFGTNRF
jgi:hypothetical protein